MGMCRWIKGELGDKLTLHLNRLFSAYKLTEISFTPIETSQRARGTSSEEGLKYIYIGSVTVPLANNAYCPACSTKVIGKAGLAVTKMNLEGGRCKFCGHYIPGSWE